MSLIHYSEIPEYDMLEHRDSVIRSMFSEIETIGASTLSERVMNRKKIEHLQTTISALKAENEALKGKVERLMTVISAPDQIFQRPEASPDEKRNPDPEMSIRADGKKRPTKGLSM